jgi:hypothetical protein
MTLTHFITIIFLSLCLSHLYLKIVIIDDALTKPIVSPIKNVVWQKAEGHSLRLGTEVYLSPLAPQHLHPGI